jgi:hypothetical protein
MRRSEFTSSSELPHKGEPETAPEQAGGDIVTRHESPSVAYTKQVNAAVGYVRDYLTVASLELESSEDLNQRLSAISAAAANFANAQSPEAAAQCLLELQSAQAGLEETGSTISVPDDVELALLLQNLAETLEAAPLPVMAATPEESAQRMRKFLAEQSAQPYTKTLSVASQRVRAVTESKVRSVLERLAGVIPRANFGRVINAASQSAGRTAGILTGLGVGLLALGSSLEAQAGEITVNEHGGRSIELKHGETGDTFLIVPNSELGKYQSDDVPNPLFDRIRATDASSGGVEYNLAQPGAFKAAVVGEAQRIATEMFGMSLSEIGPHEFSLLVNTLVERHLTYDDLAVQKTVAGERESDKISTMPIDQIFLSYGKGVCRHYSALVEKAGELLIDAGLVPQCSGMAIDEVVSGVMNHAWNVFYLNANGDGKTVVASFTDATWHDQRSSLEANDTRHTSLSSNVEKLNLFSSEELEDVYTKLANLHLGGIEERTIHTRLARINFDEYCRLTESGKGLESEAFAALQAMKEQALAAGLFSDNDVLSDEARTRFFDSIRIAAANYRDLGAPARALILVREGLSVAERLKEHAIREHKPIRATNYDDEIFLLNKIQQEATQAAASKPKPVHPKPAHDRVKPVDPWH